MADADDATVRMVVAAAISAAGPMGSNPVAWQAKISALIPQCAAMLEMQSRQAHQAKQVLEAAVFTAVYLSHEREESSTRAIVTLAKNAEGETETIRTNRTDRADGRALVEQLNRLTSGQEIRVWKAIEEMSGRQDRKVRVLVHFQPLTRNAAQASDTPSPPVREGAGDAPEEGASTPPPPAAPAPNIDPRVATIRANIKAAKDVPRTVACFKAKGWAKAEDIPEASLERALYMSLHEGEEPFR